MNLLRDSQWIFFFLQFYLRVQDEYTHWVQYYQMTLNMWVKTHQFHFQAPVQWKSCRNVSISRLTPYGLGKRESHQAMSDFPRQKHLCGSHSQPSKGMGYFCVPKMQGAPRMLTKTHTYTKRANKNRPVGRVHWALPLASFKSRNRQTNIVSEGTHEPNPYNLWHSPWDFPMDREARCLSEGCPKASDLPSMEDLPASMSRTL